MKVGEFLGTIENHDRVQVVKQGSRVFVGYLGILRDDMKIFEKIKDETVRKFRAVPELRHRRWEELGLSSPVEPDEGPDLCFRDLEMKLYYTIYI